MSLKQISVTMPKNLFNASRDYTREFGYRNLQEFILELLRKKVVLERVERYNHIEEEMKAGKKVKRLSQAEAAAYVKNL